MPGGSAALSGRKGAARFVSLQVEAGAERSEQWRHEAQGGGRNHPGNGEGDVGADYVGEAVFDECRAGKDGEPSCGVDDRIGVPSAQGALQPLGFGDMAEGFSADGRAKEGEAEAPFDRGDADPLTDAFGAHFGEHGSLPLVCEGEDAGWGVGASHPAHFLCAKHPDLPLGWKGEDAGRGVGAPRPARSFADIAGAVAGFNRLGRVGS